MEESPTFKSFLLSEYSSLAHAHFNTAQSLSSFFHYYVLIIGATVTGAGVYLNYVGKEGNANLLLPPFPVAVFLFAVSIVGFLLLWYICNLRFDALLYARAVNGIRKYFYNESNLTPLEESFVRPLPKLVTFPRYFEPMFFLPVVLTFSVLNGLAFVFSLWIARDYLCTASVSAANTILASFFRSLKYPDIIALFFVSVGAHVLLYRLVSQYRENRYLRNNTIGVDIDGVLNQHRKRFCEVFAALHGRSIDANMISEIPVHHCTALSVRREEELEVFHVPEYWIKMEPMQDAANVIRQLKEDFGFNIHIITSRPWPVLWQLPKPLRLKYFLRWSYNHILPITTSWLRRHGFRYNRLTVEERNFTIFRAKVKYRNRFRIAAKGQYRFFVEDDLHKALKLSHFCEVVFLIDQPYNQTNSLPPNIVRVQEWKEIVHHVRSCL